MAEGPPSDNLYIAGLPHEFNSEAVNLFFSACGQVSQAKTCGGGYALVRFASAEEAREVKDNMNGLQPAGCPTPLKITFALPNQGKGSLDGSWRPTPYDSACTKGQWGKAPAKGWGKGKDFGAMAKGWGATPAWLAKPAATGPTIHSMIEGLIAEGLPGGNWNHDENALYIANLPPDTTEHDLYIIFSCFGTMPPRGVKVMGGEPRKFGFCNFMESASADFAVTALNGVIMPDGCKLVVRLKTPKGQGKGFQKSAKTDYWVPPAAVAPVKVIQKPDAVDSVMWTRLQLKLNKSGKMSSYDISQWYILEFLGHVTDENEMKDLCDVLLAACAHLDLQ